MLCMERRMLCEMYEVMILRAPYDMKFMQISTSVKTQCLLFRLRLRTGVGAWPMGAGLGARVP
jgi:hypothetical protein